MKRFWFFKGIKIAFFVILGIGLFGFVVMKLWNWLIPAVLGLGTITYLQALGILLLSKILFGGFRGRGGCGHRHGGWRRRMHKKYESMTPEERKAFKERFSHCGPYFDDKEGEGEKGNG